MAPVNTKKRTHLLIIVGPTASGKSALAVDLAKKFGGEVISADSRQVYRSLDIGTAKITKQDAKGVPHHLIDVSSVRKRFTAFDFLTLGRRATEEIVERGNLPILAGGTGLYADVLAGRISLPDIPADPKLRARLEKKSLTQLYAALKKRDPRRARGIDAQNKRRLVRALEIASSNIRGLRNHYIQRYDALWIGLRPKPKVLRKKIMTRARAQIDKGLLDEVKTLRKRGASWKRIRDLGFEYRLAADCIAGEIAEKDLADRVATQTWQYAKRQITYWKRNPDILWFDPRNTTKISKTIRAWMRE